MVELASPASNTMAAVLEQRQNDMSDLDTVAKLKFFLATAPTTFGSAGRATGSKASSTSTTDHPPYQFQRFQLPNGECITCVHYNGLYHITGTDIIRILVFRFRAFGRSVPNMKKFEEGVFSDLRNLKAGTDATLEGPKSPFLEVLFRHNCIRTQKKQKVFYWYSVPHDKLFLDALERDTRRGLSAIHPANTGLATCEATMASTPMPCLDDKGGHVLLSGLCAGVPSICIASDIQALSAVQQAAIVKQASEIPSPWLSKARTCQDDDCIPRHRLQCSNVKLNAFDHDLRADPVVPLTISNSVQTGQISSANESGFRCDTTDCTDSWRYTCPIYSCGRLFRELHFLLQHLSDSGHDSHDIGGAEIRPLAQGYDLTYFDRVHMTSEEAGLIAAVLQGSGATPTVDASAESWPYHDPMYWSLADCSATGPHFEKQQLLEACASSEGIPQHCYTARDLRRKRSVAPTEGRGEVVVESISSAQNAGEGTVEHRFPEEYSAPRFLPGLTGLHHENGVISYGP